MIRTVLSALTFSACLALAGCSDDTCPAPDGGDASTDARLPCDAACGSNQTCVNEVCKYRCATDIDCQPEMSSSPRVRPGLGLLGPPKNSSVA